MFEAGLNKNYLSVIDSKTDNITSALKIPAGSTPTGKLFYILYQEYTVVPSGMLLYIHIRSLVRHRIQPPDVAVPVEEPSMEWKEFPPGDQ